MDLFLVLAFLFCVGSLTGWVLELVFRRFFSGTNPEHRWINPGFLIGPYLPLYGFGLCVLFLLANIDVSRIASPIWSRIVLFALMALAMTALEYVAGLIFIRGMNIKLWDYSNLWGNVQGIICPLFSLFWAILSAVYYFLIHPYIVESLYWLANHLAFSFFVGFFYGIFLIDVSYSMNLMARIRAFAVDNDLVVRVEALKAEIRHNSDLQKRKFQFLLALHADKSLSEHLRMYVEHERALRQNWQRKHNRKH